MISWITYILVLLIMRSSKGNVPLNINMFQYQYQNFSQLLYHEKEPKYIIASTKNYLLKFFLDDLSLPKEIRKTGPVNDSVLCTTPNVCSMSICSTELQLQDKCRIKPTDVFVKSWTSNDTHLIVCYNVYQGYCETIDLDKFEFDAVGKGYSIVTYDLDSHSTILLFENKLYTAIEINHALNYQSHDFYIMSIRTLPNLELVRVEDNVFNIFHGILGSGSDVIFPMEFKGSFHIKDSREGNIFSDYIFFLVNQPENKIDPKNGKFQVRLARICSKYDDFSSFIDIGLNCGDPDVQTYYKVDSWYLSDVGKNISDWYRKNTRFTNIRKEEKANFDQILFINFKVIRITMNYLETLKTFVTCAYPIAEVMELLDVVKKKCQTGYGSINERPYDQHSNDKPCSKEYFKDYSKGYCTNRAKNKHIIGDHFGELSCTGHQVILKDGLRASSLNVFSVYEKFTIALIGGSDGRLYQYEFFDNSYKELTSQNLFDSEISDIKLIENKTRALAISGSKMAVIDFTQCNKVSTCSSCLQLSPFCGWCISNGKCSVKSKCKAAFWIPYERNINNNMCPEIKDLNSHNILEYFTDKSPEIKFQIIKIPDGILTGSPISLRCEYYSKDDVLIKKLSARSINGSLVICNSMLQQDIPSISKNNNFVTIKLKVFVDDSFLVESSFSIYDCSRSKTCSQCSENHFGCSWCILDNTCIAAYPNSCIQGHVIESKKSHQCPKFEFSSETVTFPSGSPIEIDLKVKNFNVYQGMLAEFFCIESCGNNTVKASSKQDILKCLFENVKTSSNGVYNCSVSVIWKLANSISGYLENMNTLSIQIYNCTHLSQHCDDCLFLPSAYRCGFCTATNKCVVKSDCKYNDEMWINRRDQYCPSPIIYEIIPGNSTLLSETIILVKGRNLGFEINEVQTSISLENKLRVIQCTFINNFYISSKQFQCQIKKVTDNFETPVTFDFVYRSSRSSHLAKKEFSFYTPDVTKIEPSYGPFMGGTIIRVFGMYLNVGSKRKILLVIRNSETECEIIQNLETELSCRLKDFSKLSRLLRQKRKAEVVNFEAFISLSVDLKTFNYPQVSYDFFPDPTYIKISRNKFLPSGGQFLQVTGENINIINKPYVSFKCKDKMSPSSICQHEAKVLICLTPTMHPLTKVTDCELRLSMEKTVLLYNTTVTIYPMPTFENVPEKIILPSTSWSFIEKKTKDENLIKFKLEAKEEIYFSSFELKELNISIGKLNCHNPVVSTKFIECNLFPKEVDIYQKYTIIINVGRNFHYNLGPTQFYNGEISLDNISLAIIISLIIIMFVIIIVSAVFIVKKMQKRNKKKHQKRDIFTEKIEREANDILKQGIAELNHVTIQNDVNKNCLPIYPYNVYILYNLFPNTHPRLFKEGKATESILKTDNHDYDSSDPTSHPLLFDKPIQVIEHTVEYSRRLSKLFEDELFVLILISFLEDDGVIESKKFDIVSLLSLILMQDMGHYSQILKILIKDDFDKKKENCEETSMFRQSSLLSKLLSNWFIILMYDHFKKNPGGDLLTLYFIILNVINNGPVDFVTKDSQYALNEKSLLKGKVDFKKMKIKVKCPSSMKVIEEKENPVVVNILDCDTIPQVKLKIFEELFKYIPYSKWPKMDEFDLVKMDSDDKIELDEAKESLINPRSLKEIDRDTNCYKTMSDHDVKDGDYLRFFHHEDNISRCNSTSVFQVDSKSNSLKTNNSVNIKLNTNLKHSQDITFNSLRHVLIDPSSDSPEKSKITCCKKKIVGPRSDSNEINPSCLIYTQVLKKKLEPNIKLLFDDILDQDMVPHCIKDLFSYFNTICKDDKTLFSFKSNSLILRFWINFITNVDFLYDIPLASNIPVMECLKCISRILMDVCSESQNDYAWLTQLFSDIIKEYSPKVVRYYESINLPEDDNNEYYGSIRIEGINISLAIVILYKNYINPIHDKLIETIKRSNKPIDRQNKWITTLKEVNNLYSPEVFFSNGNGDISTTAC